MEEKRKKIRVWYCKSCGRWWRRHKKDTDAPHLCCGKWVVSGRHYPEAKTSRYERHKEKIADFKQKQWTKPRTDIGTVLKISKETKRAFKHTLKAKTKPAFIRRANLFIKEIMKDIQLYNTDKDKGTTFKRMLMNDNTISKSRGGLINSFPIVKLSTYDTGYLKGEYRMAFMRGIHEIELNRYQSMQDLADTLVHETLHYVDNMADIPCDSHGYYWSKRLDRFKSILRFNT
jgi:hypothetical protein